MCNTWMYGTDNGTTLEDGTTKNHTYHIECMYVDIFAYSHVCICTYSMYVCVVCVCVWFEAVVRVPACNRKVPGSIHDYT